MITGCKVYYVKLSMLTVIVSSEKMAMLNFISRDKILFSEDTYYFSHVMCPAHVFLHFSEAVYEVEFFRCLSGWKSELSVSVPTISTDKTTPI